MPSGPGVRWDGGYQEGDTISQFYDNLVGKLVVWAPDRERAIDRLLRALDEFEIEGIRTTIPAHVALLATDAFRAVEHSTKWVEDEVDPASFSAAGAPVDVTVARADDAEESRSARRAHGAGRGGRSPVPGQGVAARHAGRDAFAQRQAAPEADDCRARRCGGG